MTLLFLSILLFMMTITPVLGASVAELIQQMGVPGSQQQAALRLVRLRGAEAGEHATILYPPLRTIAVDRDSPLKLRLQAIQTLGMLAINPELTIIQDVRTQIVTSLEVLTADSMPFERISVEAGNALTLIAINSIVPETAAFALATLRRVFSNQTLPDRFFLQVCTTLCSKIGSSTSALIRFSTVEILSLVAGRAGLPDEYRISAISKLRSMEETLFSRDNTTSVAVRRAAGADVLEELIEAPCPGQKTRPAPESGQEIKVALPEDTREALQILQEILHRQDPAQSSVQSWALSKIASMARQEFVAPCGTPSASFGTTLVILKKIALDRSLPRETRSKAVWRLKYTAFTSLNKIALNRGLPSGIRSKAIWKLGHVASRIDFLADPRADPLASHFVPFLGGTLPQEIRATLWHTLGSCVQDPDLGIRTRAVDGIGFIAIGLFPEADRLRAFQWLERTCRSEFPSMQERAISWLGGLCLGGKSVAVRHQSYATLVALGENAPAPAILTELDQLRNGTMQLRENAYGTTRFWFAQSYYEKLWLTGRSAPFARVCSLFPSDLQTLPVGILYDQRTGEVKRLRWA